MAVSALERLPELQLESRDANFARSKFGELRVDVLLTSNPLFDEVQKRYTTTRRFVEQDIPCATIDGLILLKLYALPSLHRQGNFTRVGLFENDIATLMHAYNPPIESLLDELNVHLDPNAVIHVKRIVEEIQQRISRFEERG